MPATVAAPVATPSAAPVANAGVRDAEPTGSNPVRARAGIDPVVTLAGGAGLFALGMPFMLMAHRRKSKSL
ncbi:MAG TPA: hypothetical protein VFU07_01830 [Candidatus Lumbricidophila sp.]|nr:hypothetical protein [Candidatus Lumbricidophila sp.]